MGNWFIPGPMCQLVKQLDVEDGTLCLMETPLPGTVGDPPPPLPFVAASPESYEDEAVGSGHCVAFVQAASGAPITAQWGQGDKVQGNMMLVKGAAIATFQDGRYTNRTNGDSHAAIYDGQDASNLYVWDQWKGQTVSRRPIPFVHKKGPTNTPANRGSDFYVIIRRQEP